MKLLMLKGLPASGKSTYAKELAKDGYVRINKDDLRAMLHAGKWSKNNEQQVLRLRDAVIEDSLATGKSVVVDDTNLAPKHCERLKELAKKHGAIFETKFFDVPVEECIKRDLTRLNSVGEKVIRGMYDQFLKPPAKQFEATEGAPHAILCDIDGTLAHMTNRSPYEWSRVGEDSIDETIAKLLDLLADKYKVILVSGRDSVCRPETKAWLRTHNVYYDELFMRPEGDSRKDTLIKQEILDNNIRGKFNVAFVLDDRDQVVEMWRINGLKCLQVADGNF